MGKLCIAKRGNTYQYKFEIASLGEKRKFITKCGFKSKDEAIKQGTIAYNEYLQTGHNFTPNDMSFSDYLDYWFKEHCEINLKYHTIQAYRNITENHIKPNIGFYRLSQLTTSTIQEFINRIYVEKSFSKNFLKNILKVLKGSLGYATDVVGFIKVNPALKVKMPKYDMPEEDPAHIFSKEEIDMLFERFKKNSAVYYAFLTAYYTGLRVSEVYALTWDDIDFINKTITVNKNVIEKNHKGSTHGRHLSGNAKTVWYFGTCKTQSSYRTIEIGDTLCNALKEYKMEQERNKEYYGDSYMKHYAKRVENQFTHKPETRIVNALAELDVALPEVNLVFVKKNGIFQGTATVKYPFKVIHYELGINCRFHDFRDTHATRLIEAGADIKAVAKRLGHSTIKTTYNIYVRVTEQMSSSIVDKFEKFALT